MNKGDIIKIEMKTMVAIEEEKGILLEDKLEVTRIEIPVEDCDLAIAQRERVVLEGDIHRGMEMNRREALKH